MLNRRITSVVLVIVMLFSFAVNAFAVNDKIKDAIINDAEFKVTAYGDTKTVNIVVYIEAYPELAGLDMLNSVTKELYEKQADFADESFVLMDAKHIAGELALHVFLFKLVYIFGGNKEGSPLYENYLSFKDAELNINEERLNPTLVSLVGTLVLAFGGDIMADLEQGVEDKLEDKLEDALGQDTTVGLEQDVVI